ncbi:tyrosine kinase family protein [Zea mays]|uniref:Tyrosine kinase family protein n=1 Tax=Zea mays TaxID=4577 RepID=A0A1D6J8P1_MAIZE|nr:tyrosine kinase family protein [Zea mays]
MILQVNWIVLASLNIFYLILVLVVGKISIFCVLFSRNFIFSVVAETRYLNASNRELGDHFQTKRDGKNGVDASIEKRTLKLLQFTFQELKSATLNFRPDNILGEGGFDYVFKGWTEPNSTAPAKPGTGVTVAVKSLKPDALQGHREWVEYNAKLSDFGLAKVGHQGDKTYVSTRVVGTHGYAAPEYVMTDALFLRPSPKSNNGDDQRLGLSRGS